MTTSRAALFLLVLACSRANAQPSATDVQNAIAAIGDCVAAWARGHAAAAATPTEIADAAISACGGQMSALRITSALALGPAARDAVEDALAAVRRLGIQAVVIARTPPASK